MSIKTYVINKIIFIIFMKYYIKKIYRFPLEIVDIIYSYIQLIKITEKKIWYKRLITPDFKYYDPINIKYCLIREEVLLKILLDQKAFNIINNIHKDNLGIL